MSDRLFMCAAAPIEEGWMRQAPYGQWGVFDRASQEEGYGMNLWNYEVCERQMTTRPTSGAATLVDILHRSKERFPMDLCAGWRELIKTHMVPDHLGKKWEKLELRNAYNWMCYRDYHERVYRIASVFNKQFGIVKGSKVVIYAETQRDWLSAAFSAWFCGAVVVTIYATLGPDGAVHGINETEASLVVVDPKLLKVIAKIITKCPTVKTVITLTRNEDTESEEAIRGCGQGITVATFVHMETQGFLNEGLDAPKPEDVAVIMYTSGTTGTPKGVMISHGNVVATVAGVEHALKGAVGVGDFYMAYLPLAHIMEMVAEITFMSLGACLGFGSPSTLLSTGDAAKKLFGEEVKARNPDMKPELAYSIGDAPLLRPTFMVFPPAVLDKIYQGVTSKMKASGVANWLLEKGLQRGEEARQRNRVGAGFFSGHLFKSKIQTMIGGRVKGIISGSAPLSPEVQTFVQTVFGCPVRQGYGLTETCAASCVAFWGDFSVRSVGPPTVNSTIRLADWPEGNYRNSDKENPEIGMPRGEVLIGGPSVSLGYYINPNAPNEELEKKNGEDWITIGGIRYFRTGDIGQVTKQGTLQIIDRKKDLWKGPNGEYVALAKVEQALTLCPYVSLPMVYGRTGGDFPVALICPQKPKILELGESLGLGGDFGGLCRNDKVVEAVSKACVEVCKEKKLVAFEIPKKFALISELWTPENEMLTAAMKLKRPAIAAQHKQQIDAMYGS